VNRCRPLMNAHQPSAIPMQPMMGYTSDLDHQTCVNVVWGETRKRRGRNRMLKVRANACRVANAAPPTQRCPLHCHLLMQFTSGARD
jgi:hypothetical protein